MMGEFVLLIKQLQEITRKITRGTPTDIYFDAQTFLSDEDAAAEWRITYQRLFDNCKKLIGRYKRHKD